MVMAAISRACLKRRDFTTHSALPRQTVGLHAGLLTIQDLQSIWCDSGGPLADILVGVFVGNHGLWCIPKATNSGLPFHRNKPTANITTRFLFEIFPSVQMVVLVEEDGRREK